MQEDRERLKELIIAKTPVQKFTEEVKKSVEKRRKIETEAAEKKKAEDAARKKKEAEEERAVQVLTDEIDSDNPIAALSGGVACVLEAAGEDGGGVGGVGSVELDSFSGETAQIGGQQIEVTRAGKGLGAPMGGQDKQDDKLMRMASDLENITGRLGALQHCLDILIIRIEVLYRK